MRIAILLIAAALAACASGGAALDANLGDSPFPVERGSALPPPAPGGSHSAPPEGAGASGIDFGQWRAADPDVYGPAFQTQMRTRYDGQSTAQIRADLEANGFVCQDNTNLECRIETMEQQCAIDWYVVVERGRAEPIAGFDRMCLGAL